MPLPWPLRRAPKDHLLIACFPKSGSTYLAKALSLATGFPMRHVCAAFGHHDQDICKRELRRLSRRSVIQQHVKGTPQNIELMRRVAVRPIVLVRNIFDIVVSLDDHLRREDERMPTGFVHHEYAELQFKERIDYLIRIHLPWYFNFFMSWREAALDIETLRLTYEELFFDVPGTLAKVLDFHHLAVTSDRLRQVTRELRGSDTRFNQGISGRGERLLSREHKQSIYQLAAVWQIDAAEMASIGLDVANSQLMVA